MARAPGGTRLAWEPGLHRLRAHLPAPACGAGELSTIGDFSVCLCRSYLCSFLLSPPRWMGRGGRLALSCAMACREQHGPSLSSRTEPPFTSNALLLAESSSSSSSSSSAASLGGTEPPPHEHHLQPGPLWGASGLEAAVPPLRMGGMRWVHPRSCSLPSCGASPRPWPQPALPSSSFPSACIVFQDLWYFCNFSISLVLSLQLSKFIYSPPPQLVPCPLTPSSRQGPAAQHPTPPRLWDPHHSPFALAEASLTILIL